VPFIWPVFAPCPAFNLAQCLTFKLHIDRNSIVNMLEGASFSAETIDLRVQEHVLIDGTSQIKVGEKLELQIGGHAVILGRVTGGKQAWQVSGNFINMGEIKTASDLVIKALNIALTGITKSDADLTITAVNNAVLSSLYYMGEFSSYGSHMVSQYITQESSTSASGKLLINSGKDIQIIGAYVLGDDVHLKATNGKVIIVPIKLYNEVLFITAINHYNYSVLLLLLGLKMSKLKLEMAYY